MGTEQALAVAQLPEAGGCSRWQTQDPLMPEPWKAKAVAGQGLGMSRAASVLAPQDPLSRSKHHIQLSLKKRTWSLPTPSRGPAAPS